MDFLRNRIPGIVDSPVEFAVGIIVQKTPGGLDRVIFEVRSQTISQPGESCLPGGYVEAHETPLEAAYREIEEEIGLVENELVYVGPADIVVNLSQVIRPYVFYYEGSMDRIDCNCEVERVFTMELDYFVQEDPVILKCPSVSSYPQAAKTFHLPNIEDYEVREYTKDLYIYPRSNPLIWGITAKIMARFGEIIRK